MRFCLLDNAIVSCDDISNYKLLPALPKAERYCFDNYRKTFKAISDYLQPFSGELQLIVSTYYYLLPGFIQELDAFLGDSVETIPVFLALGETQLREVYDHYSIDTEKNGQCISCSIKPIERLKEHEDKDVSRLFCETGIETVNKIINDGDLSDSYEEIVEVVGDYDWILKENGDIGCLFSVFSSLPYIPALIKNAKGLTSLQTADLSQQVDAYPYEYTIGLCPENLTFKNQCGFWALVENDTLLNIKRHQPQAEKSIPVGVTDNSRCFIDIASDFLGNLHFKIETLDNSSFYKLITF